MPFVRSCLLLLVAVGWGGPAAAFPLPRVDQYGDPLPTGAVARLGTVRLRARYHELSFSVDGRTLVAVDRFRAYVLGPATGALLTSQPLPTDDSALTQPSEDGRTLVLSDRVTVWLSDLPSAKRVEVRPPPKFARIELAA